MSARLAAASTSLVLAAALGAYLVGAADPAWGAWMTAAAGAWVGLLLLALLARWQPGVVAATALMATTVAVAALARGPLIDASTPAAAAALLLSCEMGALSCELAGQPRAGARLARRAALGGALAVAAAGAGLLLLAVSVAPLPSGPLATGVGAAAAAAAAAVLAALVRGSVKR